MPAFWFDTTKPRCASKSARQESLKRQNDFRRSRGEKPLRQKDIHSVHHIDQDRSNGDSRNLFNCKSQDQHNNIEMQATEFFSSLFKMGEVGFDYVTKKYFVPAGELATKILDWNTRGRPNQPVVYK